MFNNSCKTTPEALGRGAHGETLNVSNQSRQVVDMVMVISAQSTATILTLNYMLEHLVQIFWQGKNIKHENVFFAVWLYKWLREFPPVFANLFDTPETEKQVTCLLFKYLTPSQMKRWPNMQIFHISCILYSCLLFFYVHDDVCHVFHAFEF